jgi:SAM-dependent methyltransferase
MPSPVQQHYTLSGLYESIIDALGKMGFDSTRITRKELATIDEFHVRGLEVTKELASRAHLEKGMKVLDVGCGVGGPCRLLADEYGCIVTGIDLTEEFIRTAILLSQLTGLQDRTHFIQADALQLPFDDNSFDIVWTQHVQMNIADKKKFYSEISRVLKPGGRFIYYDIFSINHQPIQYPVPWADTSSISHLITTNELHSSLESAGLICTETTDQTDPGINFLTILLDKIKNQEIPPAGLKLVIGDAFAEKMTNLGRNIIEKKIKLESGICRKT